MKKGVSILMIFTLFLLTSCSGETSFSQNFKDEAKSEGIQLDSHVNQIQMWFDESRVKFTGLTTSTPDDEADELTTILPLEAEQYYDYDIQKEDDRLVLSIQSETDVVEYTLEIAGPRILLDKENNLTYESSYSFE